MHVISESPLLYFGTPVVLISTLNEDGTPNLAPMSSAWWLGWRCVLGLDATSQTTLNLLRTGQCVLNLPSASQVDAVDAIARTTGTRVVPDHKASRGYRYEADKFLRSGLTPTSSEVVDPPRVLECPVQMESTLVTSSPLAPGDRRFEGFASAMEVRVDRLHLDEAILKDGDPNRIDPDAWRPLIMSFAQFYGLSDGKLQHSDLAEIPERGYPRAGHLDKTPAANQSP